MKKVVWILIGLLAGAGIALLVLVWQSQKATAPPTAQNLTDQSAKQENPVATQQSPGRYKEYASADIGAEGYDATILFFHAPWCPECRGFDQAINKGDVPAGIQILKIDYDSSQELKKKYGVTIQSTFVRVDADGDKQRLWTGYGKNKSIDAILENTK